MGFKLIECDQSQTELFYRLPTATTSKRKKLRFFCINLQLFKMNRIAGQEIFLLYQAKFTNFQYLLTWASV